MDYQGWTFPTPESMSANVSSNSPYSNVSSFFRRPSKIVKPSSRNVSPRHTGRRRTTSHVPISRTRSLLDKQRTSLQQQFAVQQQGRPLSWHPKSFVDLAYSNQSIPDDMSNNTYTPFIYGTTAANGLVTPMSYPLADEPQIQELITPLEELSAQEVGPHYASTSYEYPYWMVPEVDKQQIYAMDNMFPQQQLLPSTWHFNPNFSASDVPTAPASPTFLPIQGGVEASPLNLDTNHPPRKSGGEELVGMGLYDSPADIQSSSLLFGGGLHGMGRKKSLKLEESFEPAPDVSDADEEAEEDEDDDNDDEEPEPPKPPAYQEQTMKPSSSMAGQSFFFDSEADLNAASYPANVGYFPNDGYQMQYQGYGWV